MLALIKYGDVKNWIRAMDPLGHPCMLGLSPHILIIKLIFNPKHVIKYIFEYVKYLKYLTKRYIKGIILLIFGPICMITKNKIKLG